MDGQEMAAAEKRCSRCSEVKGLDHFHRNRSKQDGVHSACKECRRRETHRVAHPALPKDTPKLCRTCLETLPLSAFPPRQGGRDGRQSQCRVCFSAAHHAWYIRPGNRERNRARGDAWKAAHRERVREYQATWYLNNRARLLQLAHQRASTEPAPEVKRCAGCRETKPTACFGSNRSRPDGHDIYCRPCAALRSRAWSMAHWEECRARNQRWLERNREQVRARRRAYRNGQPLLVRGQERLYDARRSAERRRREAATKARWVRANRQRLNAKARARYAADPAADLFRKKLRRARQSRAGGEWTLADEDLLSDVQRGLCAYCGKDLARRYTVDHLTPVSRGGSSGLHNLALACRSCNSTKWAFDAGTFWARLVRARRALRAQAAT